MKLFVPLCFAALLLLVTGCDSLSAKSDLNRLRVIKTVVIREQVITPAVGMYFNGQAKKMSHLFGVTGALMVSIFDSAPVKIEKTMAANNIVVEKMLRDEFIKALRLSNRFTIIDTGHADAEFELTITKYGLSSIPWHKELQPVVAVRAELKSADGNIVWSFTRSMNNHSDRDIPAVLFDDYMANSELLRTGYNYACQIVAKDLVNNLSEQ